MLPMYLPWKMDTLSKVGGNKISVFPVFLQQLWLYDIESDLRMILWDIPYPEDKYLPTDTRCDFHPRWNPSVNKICFDAFFTASLTRQLPLVEFNNGQDTHLNTTRNFIKTTLILALVAAYTQLIFGTANKALPKALIIGDSISIGSRKSYNEWCLSLLAKNLGDKDGYRFYLKQAYNYRNVFNTATLFFHPKDKDGNLIEPFDYRFSGGKRCT